MPASPDITVESSSRDRVLVVECRALRDTPPEEPARARRSLLVHGVVPSDVPFMLATPKELHLWMADRAPDAIPDFRAAAKPLLREYLGRIADQPHGPLPESLDLAVASWLRDLAACIRRPSAASEADQMLLSSGLYEQMKGGCVETQFER